MVKYTKKSIITKLVFKKTTVKLGDVINNRSVSKIYLGANNFTINDDNKLCVSVYDKDNDIIADKFYFKEDLEAIFYDNIIENPIEQEKGE